MSQSKTGNKEEGDGRGCLFLIGLVILAIVLGSIYGPLVGWAIVGVGLMAAAML